MKEMPSSDSRESHGGMWAMWICCGAMLLLLLVTLFWR